MRRFLLIALLGVTVYLPIAIRDSSRPRMGAPVVSPVATDTPNLEATVPGNLPPCPPDDGTPWLPGGCRAPTPVLLTPGPGPLVGPGLIVYTPEP